jgi:hypothetical protein
MPAASQTYETHRRTVPLYHMGLWLCLLIIFVWSVTRLVRAPSGDALFDLLVAVGLILVAYFVRTFPLRVQDRLIRLEMQIRLRDLLPPELRPRIDEFTPRQLIALRFAGDRELPELAAAVLRDNIQNGTAIKKMIREWRPDDLRV